MSVTDFRVSAGYQVTILLGAGIAVAFPQVLPIVVAIGFLAVAEALASGFRTIAGRLPEVDDNAPSQGTR